MEVIKKFAANEIKTGGSRELQPNKECNKGNDDDLVSQILHTESFTIDLKNWKTNFIIQPIHLVFLLSEILLNQI